MSHIVFDVVIVPGLICLYFALVLGLVYGAKYKQIRPGTITTSNTICDMRQHRTKNNNLILPNAPSQLFQDWKTNKETRYSQQQLCLHCSGIAENQESYHNRNSETLKHVKPVVDTDFF
jgi:hypothetical protein